MSKDNPMTDEETLTLDISNSPNDIAGLDQESGPKGIRPSDPAILLAGIKQFGLAPDGSDLQDLADALTALQAELAALKADNERLRDEAVGLLERAKLLLGEVGKRMCEEQPDWEFRYDDSRADAWGAGTDCENQAERITAFLSRLTQEGKSDA